MRITLDLIAIGGEKIYFFISCFPGCLMRDESEVGEENNVKDDDGDD